MGTGERAYIMRKRLAGMVCWKCYKPLPALPGWTRGERACSDCSPRPHRVMMNFDHVAIGYRVHFMESSAGPPLGRYFNVATKEALRDLVTRGRCEDLDDFEQSLRSWGRGSVYLHLTEEQYKRLHWSRNLRKPPGRAQ